MSLFLSKQPPRSDDKDNPLRLGMFAPLFPDFQELADRHGFQVYMVYGMTEIACPFSWLDPDDYRSLGSPADPGFELRLVDEHDVEVPRGQPGELIVRHQLPWVLTPGYLHDPEATARAWRNGWFHTGDVFLEAADGQYRLIDRVKDSIRRRGENVSSAEVEAQLLKHVGIREAAVIGVRAEMEEDVLAYVVAQPGVELSPLEVHGFVRERLPYYAVPRYIQVRDSLPRSAVLRVDKPSLREQGIPAGVWDAEEAGLRLRRERFAAD
jgi:crotonobetaine/carnitine-CoA ligase